MVSRTAFYGMSQIVAAGHTTIVGNTDSHRLLGQITASPCSRCLFWSTACRHPWHL